MKKTILGIVIVIIVFFAFEYQKPVMTTGNATIQAIACVNNPPKRLAINPINYTLNTGPSNSTYIN